MIRADLLSTAGPAAGQYHDPHHLESRLAIHLRFSTNPYGWFNWIFDSLSSLPPDARILELGCGTGHLWLNLADKIPAGWKIVLSDLSQGMLDAAWRNLVVTGRAYKFELMDAGSIPYKDAAFDAVIANHMLYHVHDRGRALREIGRVLKPDGRLFASTVGARHMQEMEPWCRRAVKDRHRGFFPAPFTLENGMQQLAAHFPEVRLTRYVDSLHVTEVEPLIVYIRSLVSASELDEAALGEIRVELEAELERNGMIFMTKDSGLFEAVKQEK